MLKVWVKKDQNGKIAEISFSPLRGWRPMYLIPCGPLKEVKAKLKYYADTIDNEWPGNCTAEARRLLHRLETK